MMKCLAGVSFKSRDYWKAAVPWLSSCFGINTGVMYTTM